MQLCTEAHRVDLKICFLSGVFLGAEDGAGESSDDFGVLYRVLPEIADRVKRVDHVLTIAALAMADVLADAPAVVQRRIVLQATKALTRGDGSWGKGRLAAVAAILMTQTSSLITLGDLADLAEGLVASSSRLYVKPLSDGAGHWTVRLEVADGILLSLVQLDDDPRTGTLATVLALLLASLDDVIGSRLLDVEHLPRREGIIYVASRAEAEAQLGPSLGDLGDMPSGFTVSESVDIVRSEQPPTLVIRAEESPKAWRPSEEGLSDVHMLFGEVLGVLVPHLLARAVEPEILFPKIGATIREIGGRGGPVYSDAGELS